MNWQFWIDVGGTFTDCIGVAPDGALVQHKVLSSGLVTGQLQSGSSGLLLRDPTRCPEPPGFWNGATATVMSPQGRPLWSSTVRCFDTDQGGLALQSPGLTNDQGQSPECHTDLTGYRYQLDVGMPAPVLAIRWILGLSAEQPCPAVDVRFGTTRGTNALLTRTGAKTALITTAGFRDVPLIGNQSRPDLFALNIARPQPLFSGVLELAERIDAQGQVLQAFGGSTDDDSVVMPPALGQIRNPAELRTALEQLRRDGFESIAICLMHAWKNDVHERLVERIVRDAGFQEVSRSSEVSPRIRFVPRCETTVLDACLNPILRQYLKTLQDHLPGSRMQVMTSTGGLVDGRRFRGRDSILSGPAGGITGFSQAALADGFSRAIGFDMGGTSTDVARFDGEFEYQNETVKAGVRIMTPVLAIETVAAGGGSICGFDGVRLFVGPQSAGADPGPACYGAGGPLTVTDLNLYLGRVLPQHFPFPLDRSAVDRQLHALRDQLVQSGAASAYLPVEELAAGLIRIANDNMVHAIRRVSIARGYNPADYVLVCFGGAGGQHACSVARSLGIRKVLVHPFAGLLSAWGMGHADIHEIRQHSLLLPLTPETLQIAASVFQNLDTETREAVRAQGIPEQHIDAPRHTCELRYQGTESAVSVPAGPPDVMQAAFEQAHQRLFGYLRPERNIEVAGLQTETIGHNRMPGSNPGVSRDSGTRRTGRSPVADETALAWFNGKRVSVPVRLRQSLSVGDRIPGPAIICEPSSTIVIEPECVACVTESGSILMTVGGPTVDVTAERDRPEPRQAAADPVLLEVFSNQFTSIAEQMGEMLRRTAISTNVRERLDFSCAIFDADGQLVVNAPHVPVHLGAMGETVRAVIHDHPQMQPGDVFVTNDPWRGGSHLPDVTVVTPVFANHGGTATGRNAGQASASPETPSAAPVFFTASRAHHADIGGIQPGSMPPFSTSLAEEGIVIHSRYLVRNGRSLEHEMRELLLSGPFPGRSVNDNLADLTAQTAANACGAALLQHLASRYTAPVVADYMRWIQQSSSRRLRRALRARKQGCFTCSDSLDDGTPIRVTVTMRDDEATIDFTGTGPVHAGNLNANRAITKAAVLYTLRCLLAEDVPLNAGVLEPIRLIIPEGLLNPPPGPTPESTPAIVGGNVETSQRIVDVLFGAFDLAAGSQGTMNNLTFGDASFGYYETIGGGAGATATADGTDAVHTHMTNTRLTDPEILEQRFPVRLRQFSIRPQSGGAGRHRGGNGIVREFEFLKPLQLAILSQRRTTAPAGAHGGQPGRPGINLLRSATDTIFRDIGGCFSGAIAAGTVLRIETPGGGGWGEAVRPSQSP